MLRVGLLTLVFMVSGISYASSEMKVASGKLVTINQFESKHVAARDVHVWMPDGYDKNVADGQKYAVLYMHDGQMLFDASVTWNKQEWGVDEIAGKLIAEGTVRPFIVVGINNGGDLRHPEYIPQRPFSMLDDEQENAVKAYMDDGGDALLGEQYIKSDNYLKFLTKELKPYIESNYAVSTRLEDTAVMGSSMGGLISMYAISEYPGEFGVAACISTHWPGVNPGENNPMPAIFHQYMSAHLPDPATHRLYFDYGTETLDAYYPPSQKLADKIIKSKGYNSTNWSTKAFEGAAHTEDDWRARLHIPLTFIFGK